MLPLQDSKFQTVITPVSAKVDNASFTTVEIDTLGYRYCHIIFLLGETDIALTALKVQQSDTAGSGHADIDGADFDGGKDPFGNTTSLPGATDDDKPYIFGIDMRGKKRYLDLVATVGDGTAGATGAAVAILSRGEIAPEEIAGATAGSLIRV